MYTTLDIAKKLGCTPQAVNGYRRKAEAQVGDKLGQPHPEDGRRTVYSEDELELIKEFAPRIPVTPAETEWDEPEVTTVEVVTPTVTALGLRHAAAPIVHTQSFDLTSAQAEVAALQQFQAQQAHAADNMLSAFAKTQMLGAVLEIQKTVETMKANALADATQLLGKSQPQ